MTTTGRAARKEIVGTVRSCAMSKSIVVEAPSPKPDRLYKKPVRRTKRVMAHDEKNDARVGDTVRVVECRPLSKRKRWRLVEIVERARLIGAEARS